MKFARIYPFIAVALAAIGGPVWAQSQPSWDNSGNGMLQGTYNFRHVVWVVDVNSDTGNLSQAVSLYGTITFDGNGNYSLSGSVYDSDIGQVQTTTQSGTYRIASSGLGYMQSPVVDNALLFGLVSRGIFVASSTEDALNDLFIAAPAGTTPPTNASFNGSYWAVEMNFPSDNLAEARDAMFRLTPNGQGSLGTIDAEGYIGNSPSRITQRVSGAQYSFADGIATFTFGGSLSGQNLVAGTRRMYLSPDGDFFFGGSEEGWDMVVGVRALPGSASPSLLDGLFYEAGVDVDVSTIASENYATLFSFFGAFNGAGGDVIGHQRLLSGFDVSAFDFTYSDSVSLGQDGMYEDFIGYRHVIGAGGAIRIGLGVESTLGLSVSVKAPDFSGEGVFINPAGVVNAASSYPFTVGVSPGSFIAIYGSGLAAATTVDGNFPKSLGGVQVMVNDIPAPLYLVSPGLISAVVPFGIEGGIARVQVIRDGTASNAVTVFAGQSTPGIFTIPAGGLGYAAALHPADFSVITPANPARPGETIAVYLTGLGHVSPPVADGTPGPVNPVSQVIAPVGAVVDGKDARVVFAGLAPTLIGLYQINIEVPADVVAGDAFLDVATVEAYNTQVLLPVGGSNDAVSAGERTAGDARVARERNRMRHGRGRALRGGRGESRRGIGGDEPDKQDRGTVFGNRGRLTRVEK